MEASVRKQKGVHYTPPELAMFLARKTAACIPSERSSGDASDGQVTPSFSVLDPACGDGGLLVAMRDVLQQSFPAEINIELVGYETDSVAAATAIDRLDPTGRVSARIYNEDFLTRDDRETRFDLVIANPPYVRTQVMGGAESRRLAREFNLKGRVDLYQVFTIAIGRALKSGGVMGLLISNRFLTVKSGSAMRQWLQSQFDLRQIIDLGESRLFDAAVLPVILTGVKRDLNSRSINHSKSVPEFCRIVKLETRSEPMECNSPTLLELIDGGNDVGEITTVEGDFLVQRGELLADDEGTVWSLANRETRAWIATLRENQSYSFGDLAEIKVGIKTTADAVFIRDEWATLGEQQPESDLILPLLTHHVARRWVGNTPTKSLLYPYDLTKPQRAPIDIDDFPNSQRYLESHRTQLEGRRYLIDAGRRWYEIWVPQRPSGWANPKIVWPDISEQPKFFLDQTGAVVNGDCYWIKLHQGVDPDWLYLMLGVANSSIATQFYDIVFHNKLYAGRRRYMTQYVKAFPLPNLESAIGKRIVATVKGMVDGLEENHEAEVAVEKMVLKAFGF